LKAAVVQCVQPYYYCVVGKYQRALAWQGVEMDMDAVECIVANLIYRKFVKGYISHQHKVAVLSKTDAFPKLSTVSLTDP
jgi:hypothetical protein